MLKVSEQCPRSLIVFMPWKHSEILEDKFTLVCFYFRKKSLPWLLKKKMMLGNRGRGCQRMRYLDSITYSIDMSLNKLWKLVKNRGVWHASVHRVTKSETLRD